MANVNDVNWVVFDDKALKQNKPAYGASLFCPLRAYTKT